MWVAFRLMTLLPFLDDNVFVVVVVVVVVVVFVLQVYSVSTKKKLLSRTVPPFSTAQSVSRDVPRNSNFLMTVLTNSKVFLRSLLLCRKRRS